ncbi:hypothetical protein ABHZ45_20475, partial [Bacteroides uniformis]
ILWSYKTENKLGFICAIINIKIVHIAIILPLINNTLLISSKFKFLRKKKININKNDLKCPNA